MPAPIVYFEVAGPDGAALQAFYAKVFEWDINAQRTISLATAGIRGGIRQDPADKVIYMGVPDVNAAQTAIEAAGVSPPADRERVGTRTTRQIREFKIRESVRADS